MNLVLHLVRWDLRRFQILLPLWLLLVAASAVLEGGWPALAVAMTARQTVGITGNLLAVAEVLFSIVLVALVVQEHPLVGTSAFWMTRPIPPRKLLAAKLILLGGAVIAAPVIAEIVLMVAYEVPAAQIAGVAAQTSVFWALWLAIMMTFAALTPNMARFALLLGGIGVATVIGIATTVAILIDRLDESPPMAGSSDVSDPTSGMVQTVIIVVMLVMFLVVLYRTRDRVRAVAIGLAGFAFAFVVGGAWPWPLLAPMTETPAWASDPAMLQLSATPETVQIDNTLVDFGGRSSLWRMARARVRLSGLAPGWSADIGVRETSVRVNGGEPLTSRVPGHRASVAVDEEEKVQQREVIRRLLNVGRLIDGAPYSKPESAVILFARYAELRRVAPATGAYDGRFLVSLVRHDIEAILPFRRGAAHHNGAYRFTVDRIAYPESGRVVVLARESDAQSVFERNARSRITLYLRNPHTSEAILGMHYELRGELMFTRVIPFGIGVEESEPSGFRPRALSLQFPAISGEQVAVVFDSTWVDRSELVIVRSTEGGSVERRLAIADFPIRAE